MGQIMYLLNKQLCKYQMCHYDCFKRCSYVYKRNLPSYVGLFSCKQKTYNLFFNQVIVQNFPVNLESQWRKIINFTGKKNIYIQK